MLGGNLASLLFGDVSVMKIMNGRMDEFGLHKTERRHSLPYLSFDAGSLNQKIYGVYL